MITKTTATMVIPIIWESKWTEILKISLYIRIEKHLFCLHLPIALFGRDNSMNNLSDNFCLNTMCYCLVLWNPPSFGKIGLSLLLITIRGRSYLDKDSFYMSESLEPVLACYSFLQIFQGGYHTVVSVFSHLDHTWHCMVTLSSCRRNHRLEIEMQNKAALWYVLYFGFAKKKCSVFLKQKTSSWSNLILGIFTSAQRTKH
jgi:hypothetical protein